MTSEQWIGILILLIGLYFVICSTIHRDFILYRLKAQQMVWLYGEAVAHRFYMILGAVALVAGAVKAAGVY